MRGFGCESVAANHDGGAVVSEGTAAMFGIGLLGRKL